MKEIKNNESEELKMEEIKKVKYDFVVIYRDNENLEEMKELIEKFGGKNATSVSKSTDYLVAGNNMGPAKRQKAEELGINIISEDELFEKK